ncbi:hypothetical protein [Shewanella sp. S1-58-MNA-CIBAN-0166]|uniref:hypothetical protein n=1 Tax=Shewanella sp. S1-58-MNA-CIBAN-0166 TaxID=3140467 RepID=UPI0033308B82
MKSRIIISVFNQGLLSLFNLLLSIYFIKKMDFESFGHYSLIFAIGMTFISFQNSLIVTPMAIRTKKRVLSGLSKYTPFYNSSEFIYLILIIIFSILIVSFIDLSSKDVSCYLVAYCLRDYLKSLLLIEFKVVFALVSDIVFIILSILFLIINFYFFLFTPSSALFSLGSASLLSSILLLVFSDIKFNFIFDFFKLYRFYKVKVWSISKWASIGVIVTEIHSRIYIFVLTIFYPTEILGLVQAARVFFGPLNLLLNGWIRVARNHFTSMLGVKKYEDFYSFYYLSIFFVIAINFMVLCSMYFFWAFIENYIFSGTEHDMFLTVFLWGLCVGIIQLRMVVTTALQAFAIFKIQTYFNLVAGGVTVFAAFLIVYLLDWKFMPLSIAFGELVLLSISTVYLQKLKRVNNG